jgi:hypothetical protein
MRIQRADSQAASEIARSCCALPSKRSARARPPRRPWLLYHSCAGQVRELTVHQGLAKASTVVNEGFFFSSVMSASGET